MAELAALAAFVGAGITSVVSALKKVAALSKVPEAGWIVVACLIGIGGAIWMDVDVSALPVRGPELLNQAIVGLFAGFISALGYETKQTIRAKRGAA